MSVELFDSPIVDPVVVGTANVSDAVANSLCDSILQGGDLVADASSSEADQPGTVSDGTGATQKAILANKAKIAAAAAAEAAQLQEEMDRDEEQH